MMLIIVENDFHKDTDVIVLEIEIAALAIVTTEIETILIREMNVGNEIVNLKMIMFPPTMFKMWFEMFFIPTTVAAEASAVLSTAHSTIFVKVLAHHGSRYRDSSLEPVVTTEPANL
jgi:membrane protein CcdC involved in cytochrome C biogenesis